MPPALVHWYFENRLAPPLSGPVPDATIEWNDRLWNALCVSLEAAQAVLTGGRPTPPPPRPVNTLSERHPLLADGPSGSATRAVYMREYMRKRRAAKPG
jgi:hypothetical protein